MHSPGRNAPARSLEARAQPITTTSSEEICFHRLFPIVPQNEKLVEWCQCGLTRKKIARMGKLYLTSLRMCFHSVFLDDAIMIPWEDVSVLEKKTSFMFSAIVVTSKSTGDDLSFTAFLSGGISQIFKLMKTLWTVRERYAASEAASLSRSAALSGDSSEDDSGSSSEEEPDANTSSDITNTSDFTEGDTRRKASDASSNADGDVAMSPKLPRGTAAESPRLGTSGDPLSLSTSVSLANDPVLEDAKKKKQSLQTPKSPTTAAKPPTNMVSALTQEARSLFPTLPLEETVADSFQCSCVSGVHRLGKMYITQRYILFTSVMMEENLQIAFEDVDTIEKEQTMMILDSISIRVRNSKRAISFTSFVSRDAVYNSLVFFFTKVKKEVVTEAGEEQGNMEDSPLELKTKTSEYDLSKIPTTDSLDAFSSVATDWGSALSDYANFTKELITPVALPAGRSVLEVFRLCFDDKTKLLETYHANRKDYAQSWEDWRPTTDGQSFRGQRLFTCTTLVKAMMGKACPFTEYQRYAFLNVAGSGPTLLVQFSSQISGVMFSDAFRAESLTVFTQTGTDDTAQVTMRAYGYVQFLRSVWVKGKIQSKTINDELPEGFTALAKLVVAALENGSSGASDDLGKRHEDAAEAAPGTTSTAPADAVTPDATAALPALKPQTVLAHKLMITTSLGLATLTLVCALLGTFSAFFASVPRGKEVHNDGHKSHQADNQRSEACLADGFAGLSLCAAPPAAIIALQLDKDLLHYLRPSLLVFQLMIIVAFTGILARVAIQL